jgi:hypothetical protein
MTHEDVDDLRRAKRLLSNTSVLARFANAVGVPLEKLVTMLPRAATDAVLVTVDRALEAALGVAIRSLRAHTVPRSEVLHKLAVGITGGVGGAFGLAAIAVELPASTTLMLRSIAEIAESEGESLDLVESRLACLQVFALGGPAAKDNAVDAGYFAVRAAMAQGLKEAAEFVAKHGVTRQGAPPLVRFIAQIAARFGVPVSEKVVVQSVPVIGALGGAALNVAFLDHFQDLARGHFVVRRLERKYGPEAVRSVYAEL